MRYRRAVEKLRTLAEACERVKFFWSDTEPFLKAVYAFGDVVDGTDPLDDVQVAVAINLSPEEVPWESNPEGTDWLATELRPDSQPRRISWPVRYPAPGPSGCRGGS